MKIKKPKKRIAGQLVRDIKHYADDLRSGKYDELVIYIYGYEDLIKEVKANPRKAR